MWVNDHHGLFPSCYDNATPTSWRRDDTLSELTADFHIHILACRRGFVNHHAPRGALTRPTALRRYLTPTPPGPLPRSGRIVNSASCVLRLHMGMGSHGPDIDRGEHPSLPTIAHATRGTNGVSRPEPSGTTHLTIPLQQTSHDPQCNLPTELGHTDGQGHATIDRPIRGWYHY